MAKARAELEVNPSSARNLSALAVYQVKAGQSAQAAISVEEALKLAPSDVQVLFRAAVTKVLLGLQKEGVALLQKAVEAGYSRAAIRDDEDFDKIRSSVAFVELTRTLEGKQ